MYPVWLLLNFLESKQRCHAMRQVHNCKLLGGGLMSLRSSSQRSKVWRPNVPRSNDGGQMSCFAFIRQFSVWLRAVDQGVLHVLSFFERTLTLFIHCKNEVFRCTVFWWILSCHQLSGFETPKVKTLPESIGVSTGLILMCSNANLTVAIHWSQ